MTVEKFGDIELYLNSCCGPIQLGRLPEFSYEIQIWDSCARDKTDHPSEICGTIYNYVLTPEIRAKFFPRPPGGGNQGAYNIGATGPKVRSERPTGHWQSFQIWFRRRVSTLRARDRQRQVSACALQRSSDPGERRAGGRTLASPDEPKPHESSLAAGDTARAFRNIYVRPLRNR